MIFNRKSFIEEKKKEFEQLILSEGVEVTLSIAKMYDEFIEQSLNEAITRSVESLRTEKKDLGRTDESSTLKYYFGYNLALEELNKKIDEILE